jgi:transcriptional regulator with XRE-family HTH domain
LKAATTSKRRGRAKKRPTNAARAAARRIGRHVQRLRRERGWQQVDLGAHVGLGQGTISSIESGRRLPSLTTLIALARELGVPDAALLIDDGDVRGRCLLALFGASERRVADVAGLLGIDRR